MKVLILSKKFMAGHPRAGEPTNFREKYLYACSHPHPWRDTDQWPKIHTLRFNAKGYYKTGDVVSVRQWRGKPFRSKQEEIGQSAIRVEPIILEAHDGYITELKTAVARMSFRPEVLAYNDGLTNFDFLTWFFPKGNGKLLVDIIHFTKYRYWDVDYGEDD